MQLSLKWWESLFTVALHHHSEWNDEYVDDQTYLFFWGTTVKHESEVCQVKDRQ